MDRERGTETMPCPTCGSNLAVVTLGDGARSTVLCGACYGPGDKVAAAEEPVAREFGEVEAGKDDDEVLVELLGDDDDD